MLDSKYRQMELQDALKLIDYSMPCMFDTETCGFYGKIRLAQFYQRHFEFPVIVEWPNAFELAAALTKLHVVGHRISYDISTIQDNLGKQPWQPDKYDDTFLAGRIHWYMKDGFGLDNCVQYAKGFNPYADNDQQASDWSVPVLSENQKEYAAMDVVYLHDVYDQVQPVLDDLSYKLDILTTRYLMEMQCNGMPVDEGKLNERYAKNMKRIAEIGLKINCNSYQQVRAYIGSQLSDDHGLAVLSAQGNERAVAVRETRKLTKNNSFLTKFLNTMVDGVIYGKFTVGARSGRTTSDDQNLQQLPRSLKSIFGVDEDGEDVIVFSDFAQIQLRAVCVVTGDTALERLFRAGADLHDFVAEMIFGKDWKRDPHRQIAKTANFALLFGAGILVFIAVLLKDTGIWLKEMEAGNIKKKWLGLWLQVAAWQTKGIRDWKKGIAWQTPLGRKYTAKMMTDQLAMQIQGFEAEVAKLAMHYMMPKIKELDTRIKLRNFVHDCYLFTCPKEPELYEKLCVIIADSMQEAWRQMCTSVPITDLPMPVKVRVGYNWGDIDKNDIFIYEHKQ